MSEPLIDFSELTFDELLANAKGLAAELHLANVRNCELEGALQTKQTEITKLHDKVCCAIRQYRTMCDAFEAAHQDIQEAYKQAEKIRL